MSEKIIFCNREEEWTDGRTDGGIMRWWDRDMTGTGTDETQTKEWTDMAGQ